MMALGLVEKGTAWRIGDDERCRIGMDPWVGCSNCFTLSKGLVEALGQRGIYTLNQIDKWGGTIIWAQARQSTEDLRLDRQWEQEWQYYIQELDQSKVRIKDFLDSFCRVHKKLGIYSPKEGYGYIMKHRERGAQEWWFKSMWIVEGLEKN